MTLVASPGCRSGQRSRTAELVGAGKPAPTAQGWAIAATADDWEPEQPVNEKQFICARPAAPTRCVASLGWHPGSSCLTPCRHSRF